MGIVLESDLPCNKEPLIMIIVLVSIGMPTLTMGIARGAHPAIVILIASLIILKLDVKLREPTNQPRGLGFVRLILSKLLFARATAHHDGP